MKNQKTQEQRIEGQLIKAGIVYRNDALRNFISRLSGIIKKMEYEGWIFEKGYTKDKKDYYYKIVKCPLRTFTRTLENGEKITTIIK